MQNATIPERAALHVEVVFICLMSFHDCTTSLSLPIKDKNFSRICHTCTTCGAVLKCAIISTPQHFHFLLQILRKAPIFLGFVRMVRQLYREKKIKSPDFDIFCKSR